MYTTNWSDFMPIYAVDEKKGFFGKCAELHWLTVMFLGYPIFVIYEWIHWEMYGSGPKR